LSYQAAAVAAVSWATRAGFSRKGGACLAGLGGDRGAGQKPVVDVERQEAMQKAAEAAAGFEERRRGPRPRLVDAVDDVHAAAEGDDDIGLQPAVEFIG
jgi:hypothetical protein